MEVNNVSGAYTSASKITETEEDEELLVNEEEEEEETAEVENDTVELSQASTEYDEDEVEEKAKNYILNILTNPNLTSASAALLNEYMTTFDAAKFIRMYGPFTSTAEISAAMYAVTSGMIKYDEEE